MIRRALTTVALASAAVVLLPGVAVADNCSGLTDCYGSAQSAAGAAAGMALIIGLAVLAAPALLRGARPESRPDSTDHKQRDGAPGDGSAAEVPEVEEEPLRFDEKVRIDMAVRGWTREVAAELARHPARTSATQDRRYNLDGSRASQPATVFARADGLYVVINNVTHDVVQVGAGPLDGTHTGPTDPSWTESLRGRVATQSGSSEVRFAGPEPCYPVRAAPVAIDWCLRNRVRVLGLEGLVLAEGRLVPQPDTILDCSAERNPGGGGTVAECAERARTLIREWSAIENCFVILTLSSPLSARPATPMDSGSLPSSVPWWQRPPRPTAAGPALVVNTGGTSHLVRAGSLYRVGRDPRSDIVLTDTRVSWHHAVFRADHGVWFVEDVGSTNGTFIGSRRISRYEITRECRLQFGSPIDGPDVTCWPAREHGRS